MILRLSWILTVLSLPGFACAQLSTNAFTGNNDVTVLIEQGDRSYEYTARNMLARLNVSLAQFEMKVLDNQFYMSSDSSQNMALFRSLLSRDTTRAPLSITLALPKEQVNLQDFEGQSVTFSGSVKLGRFAFQMPVQIVGYYKNNRLLMDFVADISGREASAMPYAIKSIQITGKGVSIQNLTDQ